MNNYADRMTVIFMNIFTTFVAAVASGTILWFIWEDSLSAMFPTAISAGILAATITWWQAVKIVWIFGILIKTVIEPRIPEKKETPITIVPLQKPNVPKP
jgi:hypothetical protein